MIYRLGLSLVQNEVKRLIESPTKGFHVRATIGHKIAVNCSYSNSRHYACLAIPSRHEVHLVKSHMTFVESNHIGDRRVHRESRLLDSFWQVSGGCLRQGDSGPKQVYIGVLYTGLHGEYLDS
jgi:hypothetical protein